MSGNSKLTNGTALVAASGVIFDLWVAGFIVGDLPKPIIKIGTLILITGVLAGGYFMLTGFLEERTES